MKVATTGKVSSATSVSLTPTNRVPLDDIVRAKNFPYRANDPAHVDSLFNDIKVNGLDVPIITFAESETQQVNLKGRPAPIPATFLVAGSHRLEALKKLRREAKGAFDKHFPDGSIPINHRVYSPQEALFALLRENVQRREMSAEEIFPVLDMLTKEPNNLKGKEIAVRIGKSTAWVSQHLAVTEELDPETQAEVNSREIAVGDARKLAVEVKSKRKAGETVSTEAIREKAEGLKSKQANKIATGSQRASGDDRHISAKKLLARIEAMPKIGLGRAVLVLTDAIRYLAGESDKLPAELRKDPPKPSKVVDDKPKVSSKK